MWDLLVRRLQHIFFSFFILNVKITIMSCVSMFDVLVVSSTKYAGLFRLRLRRPPTRKQSRTLQQGV